MHSTFGSRWKICNIKTIKIAIVDDHRILREGLRVLLNHIPGVEVVIEADNGKVFVDALDFVTPNLAIIDINMPIMPGDEAVRLARLKLPDLKVIVLTMNTDEHYFQTMNKLGVDGYIIKESEYEELQHAITSVMKGGKYFSQVLLMNLLNNRTTNTIVNLTDREKEILQLLSKGYSAQEIADSLFLSVRTVEKHRSLLLEKTDSPNSISLVVYAIKNGLVTI